MGKCTKLYTSKRSVATAYSDYEYHIAKLNSNKSDATRIKLRG